MPWLSPCLNVRNPKPARSCPSVQRARKQKRPCGCFCAGPATIPRAKVCATRQNASSRPSRNSFPAIKQDATSVLSRVFEEVHGYDDVILVRDIPFSSHCEHHMVPFFGMAHIAYYPSETGVVGLSKLARLVDVFAKRLQTQEALTAQIIGAIDRHLRPRGCAVMLEAQHLCMSMRGVRKTRRRNHHHAIHRRLSRRSRRASPRLAC